jgi:FAD/FMN-containing dehydrogenase
MVFPQRKGVMVTLLTKIKQNRYINNAFGDESLSTVYGDSLERLKSIKAKVDPQRRFNQWFPLS